MYGSTSLVVASVAWNNELTSGSAYAFRYEWLLFLLEQPGETVLDWELLGERTVLTI